MGRPRRTPEQWLDSKIPTIHPTKVYRWREVPPLVRVGRHCVEDAIKDGSLKSKIVGRARVILGEWVLEWLRSRPAPMPSAPATAHQIKL